MVRVELKTTLFGKDSFTLLELLVVLFLLSLTLTLVGPKLRNFYPVESRNLPQKMKSLLQKGRMLSFLKNDYYLFVIDPENRRFYLAKADLTPYGEEVRIPEEIEIKGTDLLKISRLRAILFIPPGLSSGGEIEIVFPSGESTVIRVARLQAYVQEISPTE